MGSFGFFPLAFSISWDQQKVKGTKAEPKKKKKSCTFESSAAWAHSGEFFWWRKEYVFPLMGIPKLSENVDFLFSK